MVRNDERSNNIFKLLVIAIGHERMRLHLSSCEEEEEEAILFGFQVYMDY